MGLPFAQGGLLGVTVFFVLSGYLITSLLLVEWDNTKTIDLKNFWLRRVRRLFPAIALVIIVCMALFVIFDMSCSQNCGATCCPRCSGLRTGGTFRGHLVL